MSEPLVRERSSLGPDAYERRLRQQDGHREDPLAQLARLVGEHHDPYGDVFAEEAAGHAQPNGRREPAFDVASPRLSGDFAAIEAGLRGALAAHPEAAPHGEAEHHEFYAQNEQYAQDEAAYLQDHEVGQWAVPPQPQVASSASARGRRPIYAMVATIAVCVAGIGVAFAYKGAGSSPREIKTIVAASGPTKIQPPTDTSTDGSQDPALINRDSREQPTQLVSREEQPVDLTQAVQDNASRNADTGSTSQGDASNVPVPLSPNQVRNGSDAPEASSTDALSAFGIGMPAPKRVKVVSVRPDGTILPNDAPPAAALSSGHAGVATSDQDDPIARASTPKTASTKTTGPKTSARVAAGQKPAKVAADDSDDTASAPATKPGHKTKPQRVASVEPTDGADDQTASTGSTSGGFAVQLAAPGSESDARSASSRLAKKYADALSGRRIGFHKAQSNGKSVYRVRISSLSKEDAVSLCGKLKANGGSCFVAKNN